MDPNRRTPRRSGSFAGNNNSMPSQNFSWAKQNVSYQVDHLLFREMTYTAQSGRTPHTHGETHLIFFLEGVVQDFRKEQTLIRTPATLIVIPPDERHATHFSEQVRTFEMVLPSSWTERVQKVTPLLERPVDFESGPPLQLATRLYREFQNRNTLTPLLLEGLMLELLAEMARNTSPLPETHRPSWLNHAQDYLHAYFTERLSLATIAEKVGVHPSHLVRAFRQHFRCTIGDYVRNLRIQQARQELAQSDTSIHEIALTLGYSDQSHFTTAFKRQTGISPAAFRRIYRK